MGKVPLTSFILTLRKGFNPFDQVLNQTQGHQTTTMPVIDNLTGATRLSGLHLLLAGVGVSVCSSFSLPHRPSTPVTGKQEHPLTPTQIILYIIGSAIYNLFFHPLASYPGPLIQRASYIPYAIRCTTGTQCFHTQRLHDKYGPVVRVSPNHLSFTDYRAWKDVYGHIAGSRHGTEEMAKSISIVKPVDEQAHHIISADRELHQKLRRALANSFSDASMKGQGPLIGKYIDLLIHKLHEQGQEGRVPLNASNWFNCTTFDITGDLIFGMPFGALEGNGTHSWLEYILGSLKSVAPMQALSYVGLHWFVQVLWKLAGAEIFRKSMRSVDAMLRERLKMDADRNDLFEGLVQRQEKLVSALFLLVFSFVVCRSWFFICVATTRKWLKPASPTRWKISLSVLMTCIVVVPRCSTTDSHPSACVYPSLLCEPWTWS